jgi:hypothetical protein
LFFIAETPVHVAVRSEIPAIHNTAGQMISPKQRRLYAKFRISEAPKWAYEVGAELYDFQNRPDVPPERQMGFYDTLEDQQRQAWTDEEVALIEEALLNQSVCVQVEPPQIAPPYPGYDKFRGKPEDLARKLVDDGYSVDHAYAYESANKNRASYLAAFDAAMGEPEQEESEAEVIA